MKNIIAATLTLILAACAEPPHSVPLSSQDGSENTHSNPGDSTSHPPQKKGVRTGQETQQLEPQTAGSVYQCPNYANNCTQNDLLVAASNEEADWLSKNGYPSIQKLKEYESLTLEDLKEKENKSQIDTLILSEKMAEKNERNNGMALAHSVAMQGNLYALYVLSEIHAMPGQGYDRTESGAYLKLAYLMGDSKAADLYYEIYGNLSAPEHLLFDRRASRLMQTMSMNPKKPRPIQ